MKAKFHYCIMYYDLECRAKSIKQRLEQLANKDWLSKTRTRINIHGG